MLTVDVGWQPPDVLDDQAGVRVAFWNAAGRPRGWDAASQEIAAFNADLIGLVECGVATTQDRGHFQRWFPAHNVDFARPGLGLLVRGRILGCGVESLGSGSDAGWWDVALSEGTVRVLVVDVASNPMQSRHEALVRLGQLIEVAGDRPLIVMGDFNTPLEAPSLAVLAQGGMSAATNVKGRGYRCTWPTPLPVLTLDQIWINARVTVHAAGAGWSWNSDHRPVHAVVTFGTSAPLNAAVESATATE
jgi:endonuclease/exonuclease/phosphatase family metal-dependent hydrolase